MDIKPGPIFHTIRFIRRNLNPLLHLDLFTSKAARRDSSASGTWSCAHCPNNKSISRNPRCLLLYMRRFTCIKIVPQQCKRGASKHELRMACLSSGAAVPGCTLLQYLVRCWHISGSPNNSDTALLLKGLEMAQMTWALPVFSFSLQNYTWSSENQHCH